MRYLFIKAVFAFLVLPGTIAFAIPLLFLAPRLENVVLDPLGYLPLLVGLIILFWCIAEFYIQGRGTLAPWSPPQRVVITGLYRYSRNPMYIGVLLILSGWSILFHGIALIAYTVFMVFAFHLRVILYEEKWQARVFGEQWQVYKARVPRWIGLPRRK